jgi:hypothetical protein
MKYRPEFPPNNNVFTIHTNVLLSKEMIELYSIHQLTHKGPQPPPEWIRKILRIRGVYDVSLHRYQLHVTKEELFDFKKIAPKVLEIFLDHMDPNRKARDLSDGMVQRLVRPMRKRAEAVSIFKSKKEA